MSDRFETAFPIIIGSAVRRRGLTKREYFAGLAMQGQCSSFDILSGVKKAVEETPKEFSGSMTTAVARSSVEFADALIAELEK